jgi:hypothetical protein
VSDGAGDIEPGVAGVLTGLRREPDSASRFDDAAVKGDRADLGRLAGLPLDVDDDGP